MPKYTFYNVNDETTKYKVMFQILREVDADGKQISGANIALPSMKWVIEQDADDTNILQWQSLPTL